MYILTVYHPMYGHPGRRITEDEYTALPSEHKSFFEKDSPNWTDSVGGDFEDTIDGFWLDDFAE